MRQARIGWFRFRTRTLLALVAVVSAALAYQANQARQRQRAIDHLVGIGGHVITGSFGPEWLRSIVPATWTEDVWCINFNDQSPPGRHHLEDCPFFPSELEIYFFYGAAEGRPLRPRSSKLSSNPESLAVFSALRRCAILDLSDVSIGDADIRHLPHALRVLDLRRTDVTDAAVPALATLRELCDLDISETAITARGVELLRAALPETVIIHGPKREVSLGNRYRDAPP